jgi:nicotinamidase-related amidase
MALTIDKQKTALLIMDCENDLVHKDGKIAAAMGFAAMIEKNGTLKHIRTVLDAARAAKIPVIYIEIALDLLKPEELPRRGQFFQNLSNIAGTALQKGSWGATIHEEVKPAPGEPVIGKCIISAFARSQLDATLKQRGITDLILTGVATNMVVESTARDAVDRGYSVITVEDGVTSFNQEAHQGSIAMLRMLGDVASASEVASALRS